MSKQKILYLLSAVLLIYGIIDYINYSKNNYDIVGFNFVCNEDVCEISHKKVAGKIKYTDKINIAEIERFRTQLEKIPRTKDEGLAVYADRKDGTSFRLSPVYIRPSRYVEKELIIPLNQALAVKPININMSFPH